MAAISKRERQTTIVGIERKKERDRERRTECGNERDRDSERERERESDFFAKRINSISMNMQTDRYL